MDFVRVLDPSKLVLAGTVSHVPVVLSLLNLSLTDGRLPPQCFCFSFIQLAYISLWMLCPREQRSLTIAPNCEQCAVYELASSLTNLANHY